MKNTVAIVGSHPQTSRDFDFDRTDCDIWIFNEALSTPWCKRATGVFQMHQPVIWRSATNRNDPKHYEWLKSGDTPTIYMIDKYDDVPMSERFPKDEIMEMLPSAEPYFTSSVAYALALAIYKGYKRIEVYGVEMETGTEYGHQRSGVAYWVGIAVGRGIEVDYHSKTFFKSHLYGYDGDVQIPIAHYDERIGVLRKHKEGAAKAFEKVRNIILNLLNEYVKSYKTDLSELDAYILAIGKNAHNYGMMDGAIQTNEKYRDKSNEMIAESGDFLIVRQEYESYQVSAAKQLQKEGQRVKAIADELHVRRNKLNYPKNKEYREKVVQDIKEALQDYTDATTDMGRASGIMNENRMLVFEYDKYLQAAGITPGDHVNARPLPVEEAVPV